MFHKSTEYGMMCGVFCGRMKNKMDLRGNTDKSKTTQDIINALYGDLLNYDEDKALFFAQWCLEKCHENKWHDEENKLRKTLKEAKESNDKKLITDINARISKILPPNYPRNISLGEIVYIKFGAGYAGELTKGHYGIIISSKGSMFLVAPLTKTKQPDGDLTMTYSQLCLPGENGMSYVNFGQIRYIHFRRIERIKDGIIKQLGSQEALKILNNWNKIIELWNKKLIDKTNQ